MGNNIAAAAGSNKKANCKIMKIDGKTFKLKAPATAMDALKDYSEDHVLLESEAVKKFGIRAPKLPPWEVLKPGKVYFLVEMPKFPRSTDQGLGPGSVRVKMRVPRSRIEKLMEESRDEAQVAEKIVGLCLEASLRD